MLGSYSGSLIKVGSESLKPPTVVCVSQIGAESLTFGVPSGGNRVNPWEEPRGDQPDVCNAWGLEQIIHSS